ncbi:restriction endonuclease subunit S [Halostagnicola sp. A56]|uniref:restriction endonuclease subunit S n=1 Tax=Halostagnicola sp. A56 TaxID=1495067 RepID=UPI0009E3378A|nr:restriction endonuclease subunit S [Halostagnicola sp. A56]
MSGALDQEPKDDYQTVSWGPREEDIPLDWEMKCISDISENVIYPQRDKPKNLEGEIPWIRIEDLDGKYISESGSGKGVTQDTVQDMNLSLFPPGTLMCSCSGNMGICAITERELVSNQTFAGIVPSKDIDTEYLYYTLENLRDDLQRLSSGTTIPYLSSNKLKKFSIPYPPLPEQRRIADILSTVEDQILQTSEMIEKTKELKCGLIQDIFDLETDGESSNHTSEISLEGVQEQSLSDYVSIVSGVHVKSDKVSDDATKTPYLTGPDDFDEFGFSVTKFTDEPSKFCEPGDTLVTVKGSGCGKTTFANKRASISRQLKALRPGEGFIYH